MNVFFKSNKLSIVINSQCKLYSHLITSSIQIHNSFITECFELRELLTAINVIWYFSRHD